MKNILIALTAMSLMIGLGCTKTEESKPEAKAAAPAEQAQAQKDTKKSSQVDRSKLSIFKPLPKNFNKEGQAPSQELISLGQKLYHEKKLSKADDISCNTCHDVASFGVDGKPVSDGHNAQKGERNSPTVFNAAGHFVQFWDGRAEDVEEQALGPILNPVEMAMDNEAATVKKLKGDKVYADLFKKAFPADKDPMTFKNIGIAIGAFERQLVTPSRWDKFLEGEDDALSEDEKVGLNAFVEYGCQACHAGPLLGGNMYQKTGSVKPWPNQKDQGRYAVTKKDSDKMLFKVPSLRNITQTAPYFHDGSEPSLEKSIQTMGEYQLGREIPEADAKAMATFFKALKGKPDPALTAVPQ